MKKIFHPTLFLLALLCPILSTAQTLTVSKSVDNSTVLSGEDITFTIQYACPDIENDCNDVTIVDVLPPELEFVSATGSVHTTGYTQSGNTITFDFGPTLAAGSTGEVLIKARFPNGTTPNNTSINNTATIDGSNAPSVTSPPVSVTANAVDRFTASKQYSGGVPDEYTVYAIKICNDDNSGGSDNGTLNPTNITIVDNIPAGATFVEADNGGVYDSGAGVNGTVTWTHSSLPLGHCKWFEVTLIWPDASYDVGDEVTNTADVTYTPTGESQATIPVSVTHNLENSYYSIYTTKTGSHGERTPGSSGRYHLHWQNWSNVELNNFHFEDAIPEGLEITYIGIGAYYISGPYDPNNLKITVQYKTNLNNASWTNTPDSPYGIYDADNGTNEGLQIDVSTLGLASNEFITNIRWDFGPDPMTLNSGNYVDVVLDYTVMDNPTFQTVENCIEFSADEAFTLDPSSDACVDLVIDEPVGYAIADPWKGVKFSPPGLYQPGDTINFRIRAKNGTGAGLDLSNPVLVDLLPAYVTYNNFWEIPSWQGFTGPTPIFTVTPNYNGSGRTLLKWEWTGAAAMNLAPGEEVQVYFDATVNDNAVAGTPSFENEMILWGGNLGDCWGEDIVDIYDLDGDDDTTETLCAANVDVNISAVPALESEKLVKGQLDTNWTKFPDSGLTVPGGTADYQLYVRNVGTMPMTNIVVIDILPFVGDKGVIDPSNRLTEWRPNLVAAVNAPAGVTVYYSTSDNPCRDTEGIVPTGPAGCSTPNWTTIPPADITTVQSLKFDFGNTVLNPGSELLLEWAMRAPLDAPTAGEIAWNSFGYIADRVLSDGSIGAPILASEPIKVGIATQPFDPAIYGDLVWLDTNENGIKDGSEVGLDGIRVELYEDNGDNMPDPNTDSFVSFTLTTDGGQYIFPNLDPGNYFAVFYLPPTYALSPTDNNGNVDDTVDSDGTLSTFNGQTVAIVPVTNLIATEEDYTWDIGLYQASPPITAIGNYVWYDANNDGIQNESSANGINGIVVNLYQDNGDNIANTSSDTFLSTVFTSNDVNGNPGYYLFDNLDPNVNYFVEFELSSFATFTTQGATGSSDASDSDPNTTTGLTEVVDLASNDYDATWDAGIILPVGSLSLGNIVWFDENNDGEYDSSTENGINGVQVNLYVDTDDSGDFTPNVDEFWASTTTYTNAGEQGYYLFSNLPAEDYIVQIDANNFTGLGELGDYLSSSGNGIAPDPDDNENHDDNGEHLENHGVVSQAITLSDSGEPINDGDSDNNSNLTIDFGFRLNPCPPIAKCGRVSVVRN